jgi:septal ring factor EnvC (AmiA/AmiB activator)
MNLSRSLQHFGVAALACLVIGSAIALSVVKDRIQIVVSEPEDPAERGPDPLELLRADVTELRAEIARGDELLPQHLQTVHDSLASGDSERDTALRTELAQLRAQLATLETRLDTSARASEAARTQTQESLQRLTSSRARSPPTHSKRPSSPAHASRSSPSP